MPLYWIIIINRFVQRQRGGIPYVEKLDHLGDCMGRPIPVLHMHTLLERS